MFHLNNVLRVGVWLLDRGLIGWLNLLTTCTHHTKLQVITALSLIPTIHRSPQHPLSPFQPFESSPLPFPGNGFKSGDSSVSHAYVIPLPYRTACQLFPPELSIKFPSASIRYLVPIYSQLFCQTPTLETPSVPLLHLISWQADVSKLNWLKRSTFSFYNPRNGPRRKLSLSIVEVACFPHVGNTALLF
jgi:hypothetical protein